MQVEYRKTSELIPYINNSRTHTDEQVNQIASSIKEFGFTNPVLVDQDSGIIAGHGRIMAASKLSLDECPTIKLSHLTEAQKKAYIIADNNLALNAGWDDELLKIEIQGLSDLDVDLDLLGFDSDFIDEMLAPDISDGLTDEDEIPEAPEIPITKKGDLWILGNHRLLCGDSANVDDVERLLSGKTVDLIFTDPPYGVSYADKNAFLNAVDKGNRIQVGIKNDHMTVEETGQLWGDVFSLWSGYMSDYSSYYITSPQGGDLFLMMIMMMNENGLPLKHTIIWNKNNHVLGRTDYNYKHEPILYGWNNRHKFYGKGEHKFSVWNINKPLKNDLHPTMKPVELVENCIKNSSQTNQIVADMFLGSGTTVIAAEKNNRACYGMELDEHYCDVIVKRWMDYTGKIAILESTGEEFKDAA